MSIPLAATSVQIKNLTSFFYSGIKNTQESQTCVMLLNNRNKNKNKTVTLNRSKLYLRSLGFLSPWRQTHEN